MLLHPDHITHALEGRSLVLDLARTCLSQGSENPYLKRLVDAATTAAWIDDAAFAVSPYHASLIRQLHAHAIIELAQYLNWITSPEPSVESLYIHLTPETEARLDITIRQAAPGSIGPATLLAPTASQLAIIGTALAARIYTFHPDPTI